MDRFLQFIYICVIVPLERYQTLQCKYYETIKKCLDTKYGRLTLTTKSQRNRSGYKYVTIRESSFTIDVFRNNEIKVELF